MLDLHLKMGKEYSKKLEFKIIKGSAWKGPSTISFYRYGKGDPERLRGKRCVIIAEVENGQSRKPEVEFQVYH